MAVGEAQDATAARVEVRVWQQVENEQGIHISARPADGDWRTLGTVPLPLDDGLSSSGRYRFGDISIEVPLDRRPSVTIEVRVWQDVEDSRAIYISGRHAGGSWRTLGTIPLPLDGLSSAQTFRFGDIALDVPIPADPAAEACSNGVTVPGPESNTLLVADCVTLLRARDLLVGDGPPLDWGADRPIQEWTGVSAYGTPQRVTELSLEKDLFGQIPPVLAELRGLLKLSLESYGLTGGIPPELGTLPSLQILVLRYSGLTGEIPLTLTNLPSLWYLDLSGNSLTGDIPPALGDLERLSYLLLGSNELTGGIPPELGSLLNLQALSLSGNQLSGEIPSALGNLHQLWHLDLGANELTGEIPSALGNLHQLWHLELGANELTGEIPPALTDLQNLSHLYLGHNQLTGEISPELALPGLQVLYLQDNQLTGEIPREFGATMLNSLYLYSNQLTGRIPAELGQLSNLTDLKLDGNGLTGRIPRELGSLLNLTDLSLADNDLTGPIPSELGQLSNLSLLALDRNNLTGEIPPDLGRLSNLTRLFLGENDLSGPVPVELGQLSNLYTLTLGDTRLTCMPRGLQVRFDSWETGLTVPTCEALALAPPSAASLAACSNGIAVPDVAANAGLVRDCAALLDAREVLLGDEAESRWSTDGPIEEWEGLVIGGSPPRVTGLTLEYSGGRTDLAASLSQLKHLETLSARGMEGSIPPQLGQLPNLRVLNLENNDLTGVIPPQLADLENLEELNLSRNDLTGAIPPELGGLPRLRTLNLESNGLTGEIPPELGGIASLRELWLDGNRLKSEIPPELGGLTALEVLRLSSYGDENTFTGEIPAELGQLANLTALELSSTGISGVIPPELGSLASLENLDLSGTQLSGTIPPELGSLTSLTYLNLAGAQFRGEIPRELGLLENLTWLYLSGNALAGEIPPELGMLPKLRALSLSNNDLTGPIPPELGSLAALSSLDLHGNRLTGGIPREFGHLTELDSLNLRDNQLSGSIPAELGDLEFDGFFGGLWLSGNQWEGCLPLALRPLLEETDYTRASDIRTLGMRYCQCLPPPEGSLSPDLSVGVDGIPYLPSYEPTDVPGTYRLSFSLVIDLPAGGVFSIGGRQPGRDHGGILVRLYETSSASYLTLDPFTGHVYARSAVDGPEDCESNPSSLLDAIAASAREQFPYVPPVQEDIQSADSAEYLEGGNSYWLNERARLVFDVPEGWRLTQEWSGVCRDPGRCHSFVVLVDEESGSRLPIDTDTGETEWWGEVTEAGKARGVEAVFDAITASVRLHPPAPSCQDPATAPDCAVLLEARDTLAGDAELNWSAELSIRYWWGVFVDRRTGRVRVLDVSWMGLTGRIPAVLGQLSALTRLQLGHNQLTGEIPGELGQLEGLWDIDLGGNQLEGCVPEAWRDRWIDMGTADSNPDLQRCQ